MTDPIVWQLSPAPYIEVRRLVGALGISEVLAQILVRRGYREPEAAQAFLYPDVRVHNPFAMAGMAEARRRIDQALKLSEPIAIYGDYDVDGVSATFLLVHVLRELGADVRWRLPNRFADGYGLSTVVIDELAESGVGLAITVDCGITARAEVQRARELGMDVIVTDHHEPVGALPDCLVLAPKQTGYPFAHLAGVGVAFKLAHALLEEPREPLVEVPLALRALTDVVAVGTIADLVPLVGENRVLATIGLGRLRSAPRPGLAALMEVSDVIPDSLTAGTVGFRLAPRLNAAGRLEDASLALALLECETRAAALPLALRLDELNRERQAIEAAILAEARAMVPDPLPAGLVLASPTWHEGVVGIVASRVAEEFNRPTILLSEGETEAKGSGRSIAGFDLLAAVERGAGHLLAFGGHHAACGLRLRRADIGAFRVVFAAAVAAELGSAPARRGDVDALVGGHELTLALADELERLAPHGLGNRAVQLLLRDAEVLAPRLTRSGRHAQYRVRCHGASCQAIHFNFADLDALAAPGRHDMVLALSKNEYNGSVSAQVEVKGLAPVASAADLCPTSCSLDCRDCLRGADLWRVLLPEPAATSSLIRQAAEASAPIDERVVDRRGKPLLPAVGTLLAGGESVLVLVAELGRRRPLLNNSLLNGDLPGRALYVHGACCQRLPLATDARLVVAGIDLLAIANQADLRSRFAAFEHIVFADPPLTTGLFDRAAALNPQSWLHLAWGRLELDFALQMRQAEYDLQGAARHLWRRLNAGAGALDDTLADGVLAGESFLPSAACLAAAFRVLHEAGLVSLNGDDRYELHRPAVKVDITQTESYAQWHTLFQTNDYLPTCLTSRR